MTDDPHSALREAARVWIEDDPDEDTRREIETLLAKDDLRALSERFDQTLAFGTAGLRGMMGAGPNRMNRVMVQRATAALCAWVAEQIPDAPSRGICVGFDARHKSQRFAEDACAIIAGAGICAHRFSVPVPTPHLAFAVLDRRAAAGIMITASHNPPGYNGYKVFWEHGAQIVAPHDAGIAAHIARRPRCRLLPRKTKKEAAEHGLLRALNSSVVDRYRAVVKESVPDVASSEAKSQLTIAYTALHGVGDEAAREVFRDAGFTQVRSVPEQAKPDGRFPTVSFPNPEEPGALDCVLRFAKQTQASLVLANDPDADRLAAAVLHDEQYVVLSGNEIGCLLAHFLLTRTPAASGTHLVMNTIVSSPMLRAIADAHGARYEQTLTGHKWIHSRAIELEKETGARFLFGYEEALGYAVGSAVRDKDGLSAAAAIAHMAAWCCEQGRDLVDELHLIWRRYGMYLSEQRSLTIPGAQGLTHIQSIMARLRADPPRTLGEFDVAQVHDLREGALNLPPSDLLVLDIEGGHRAMARPSGTEPKLKFYVDVRMSIDSDEPVARAQTRGTALLDKIMSEWMNAGALD